MQRRSARGLFPSPEGRRNGESLLDIQKRSGHLTARAPFRRERVSMRERPHAFCIERGLKRNRRHEHDHAIIITDVTSGPYRMRPRKTGRGEISQHFGVVPPRRISSENASQRLLH